MAKELGLGGYVKNSGEGVEIVVSGAKEEKFLEALKASLPPLAKIEEVVEEPCDGEFDDFVIKRSEITSKTTLISPDISVCKECLADLFDPANRRHYYPLINCTNCGPRYTIIEDLPYDRKNTSMAPFRMCQECQKEYEDPSSRFYHAQPISCYACGPKVRLGEFEHYEAIQEAARLLQKGLILAIKGIGGYHLVCNALDEEVVAELRRRKRRSKKPFAVMFSSLQKIERYCEVSETEKALITSKERPIVVVKKKEGFEAAAPDIDRLGVFLPYTPLYYLLFSLIDTPLVVTSANISEEPIIKEEERIDALGVADEVLWYDREIVRSCDDSVVVVVDEKPLFYRLSRGYGPKSFHIARRSAQTNIADFSPALLAVGARQKNTIAIAFDQNVILSPHIGDIKNIESFEYFKQVVEDFAKLYDLRWQKVVCDKHPGYETSQYARSLGIECVEVQHHMAHIYAAKAEMKLTDHPLANEEFIGFAFDGTGYGDDGAIWGGEVFVGDRRKYHFDYFDIAGGERAIKDIKLIAYSLMHHAGFEVPDRLVVMALEKRINTFTTSSVGRLFDAIAYVAGLCEVQEYEGYSGLLVERAYRGGEERYEFWIEDGKIKIDFSTLLQDKKDKIPTRFINTLADIILYIAKEESKPAILSGGVFQNKTLLEVAIKKLKEAKIDYFFPTQTPINDGGIALGQLWWALNH